MITEFLTHLYPSTTSGWFSLWELPGKTSRHFDTSIPSWRGVVAQQVAEWDGQNRNVFFGVGLRARDFGQANRGTKNDVVALPGFWLDIDLAGPGHAGSDLPPNVDAVVEKLLNPFPPPSLVVHSGGGLHCYWLFNELIPIATLNGGAIQASSKAFQAYFITLAKAAGWKLDNTSDLARVLRPVGSHNRKTAEPRPVVILGSSRARYSYPDLMKLIDGGATAAPDPSPAAPDPAEAAIVEQARAVLGRQKDPDRQSVAQAILSGAALPAGSRDISLQRAASWLASAMPNAEPETLAVVFEGTLDAMAAKSPDDHFSFEDVVSKISRAQGELRPRREAEAVRDAALLKALTPKPGPVGNIVVTEGPQIFPYGMGQFRCDVDGVYWDPVRPDIKAVDTEINPEDARPVRICTPLRLLATSRDRHDEDWGTLIEITNLDGRKRILSLPMETLSSVEGSEIRRPFLQKGARPSTGKKARELLITFLTEAVPVERVRCVSRVGWYNGLYVLPEKTVGEIPGQERVVYQSPSAIRTAYEVEGDADAWKASVGAWCVGNSRFVLGVSAAFAGALLELAGEDGGGFHFRGPSSTSKTTILKVAASVHGKPADYIRTWRVTSNGLEGVAAIHNDGVLCVDELGQVEAREAGAAAYMLANGQGKTRATRNGTAREAARWRLLFLSTGETSLAARAAESGNAQRTQTGQEIRLAEIAIDAGAGMGGVENLHGCATAAAFAEAIKDAASKNFGAVGEAWLGNVVRDRAAITEGVKPFLVEFVGRVTPEGSAGQVLRVARRFAVVAYAGELATAYGLTGWPAGEATSAAEKCFGSWLSGFGGALGHREERSMVAQVRAFLEAHGSARFEPWGATDSQRIANRVGVRKAVEKDADGKTASGGSAGSGEKKVFAPGRISSEAVEYDYYVFGEAWKNELCKGIDYKEAAATLGARGCLVRGPDGKNSVVRRLPGAGTTRCYVITPKIWEITD